MASSNQSKRHPRQLAGHVIRMVVKEGMVLAVVGILGGFAGAVGAGRAISSLLYDTSATDTATFAAISGVLAFVALLACYAPARKAARVDPLIALRRG